MAIMEQQVLFWTKVAAIGQVAGAIATFAAVFVSLHLARQAGRVRLAIRAGLRIGFYGDGSDAWDLISVSVENLGDRPVRISNVGWRSGWSSRGPKWLRYQFGVQRLSAGSQVPCDLAVGADVHFTVLLSDYENGNNAEKNLDFFGRRLPWSGKVVPSNVQVVISAVGSPDIYVPVEMPLSRYLTFGELDGGARRFNNAADEETDG